MSKRLAVVVGTFPRWSERFIARELCELRRRGVTLEVFALQAGSLPSRSDPGWEDLLKRVRILPRTPSGSTLAAALKAMPSLRTPAARARLRSVQKALGSAGVLRCARAHVLERWLREGCFEHVHAHFANLPSTIAWIAARDAGLPWSFSVHARDIFVEAQLLEEKARDARAVLACHRRGWERLERIPGLGRRAILMPHGLPLEQFPFRGPDRLLASTKPRVELLAAGRFVEKKGFADLLAALNQPALAKRVLLLTLLGEGPKRADLQREIVRRGLAAKVQLRPPEPGRRFQRLLARAAALAVPSRSAPDGDLDGIPNVVLEAFALGTPVVGTEAGGLPEVLDEATGYRARSGDPASLAQALAACLDDPRGAEKKSRAARALVEERFDIRKNVPPLLNVLEGA